MTKTVEQMLTHFENAIGQEFTLTGEFKVSKNFKDVVDSVNRREEMVIGRDHGEFHVAICKLLKTKTTI